MFFFTLGIAFFHVEAVFEEFLDLPWISFTISVMGILIFILALMVKFMSDPKWVNQ